MKLLTVAIPCYNSQAYMEHAVETALVGGEDVEIILVNDGSSDKTAEIADRLQKRTSDDCTGDSPGKRGPRGSSKYRSCQCKWFVLQGARQ